MSVTENIITGVKYRVLADDVKNIWNRISMWTMAEDVEMKNGNSLEMQMKMLRPLTGSIVCIGDSYLAGWTPDGNVKSWGVYIADILGKTVGENMFISAEGGAGFCHQSDANKYRFIDLLTRSSSMVSQKDTVTAVIVLGAGNDHDTYPDYELRINNFISKAKELYPNCIVYVGHGTEYFAHTPNGRAYSASAMAKYVPLYGGIYLGNILDVLFDNRTGNFSSDNVHPNDVGQQKLAVATINAIMGGSITSDTSFMKIGSTHFYNWISNGVYHFELHSVYYGTPDKSEMLCAGEDYIATLDFGGYSEYLMRGCGGTYTFECQANGFVYDRGDGKYYDATFLLRFVDDKIRLYPIAINNDRSNYLTLTNATNYGIYPFMWTISADLI